MKLRLLLHSECNRSCSGCCNKDWDLAALPIVSSFKGFSEIMLTGGEPMLHSDLIFSTIESIKKEDTKVPIYLYTADVSKVRRVLTLLSELDGLTLTLHNQEDIIPFEAFNSFLLFSDFINKSLRLNVFKGVDLNAFDLSMWRVKKDMEWVKNCPLPLDEVFMRLS
jgi:organic radical activating enzyme